MTKALAACLLLIVSVIAAPAWAQSGTAADLEGIVTDAAGGAVADASLVVVNVETGITRQSATNALGRYRVSALPVGEYELRVTKAGFASVERKGLVLQVGQVATLNIELPVATQFQQVTVSESAPIIEAGRANVGAVVNRNEIDSLPINGRNFLNYSLTVAGVTAQQTSGQGSGLSFNGQRGRSNNISIDGADNNGQLNGNSRLTMSQEAVREFQVVTNQFAPEFGQAGGGLVNIVSRSGTNEFHGNLFLFARDEALDGRNAFATGGEKPPFRRKNTGATLGGPILRNRTFFFAAVEYTARHESDVVTISDQNVAAINQVLAQRPIPNSGVKSIANGVFPVDQTATLASLKLDHSFSQRDSVAFRYIFGQERESNAGGVAIGGLTDVTGGGGSRDRDQSFLGTWTHIFSPAVLSETRYQYAPRLLSQYANDPGGPRITISGVATFGRSTNFPVMLDEGRHQVQQGLSWQHGRHFFKFGADITRLMAHTSFPVSFAGNFSFASLADFAAGRANSFSQGFGDPEMRLPDKLLGFYAQDSYRLNDKVTLAYGVRYDYDMQPQGVPRDRTNPIEASLQDGINRDGNNWAPRFGLTYNPDGKGRTLIRTGYGIFYDKIFLLVARNALLARQTISLNSTQATARFPLGAFPESRSFPTGYALPKPTLNTVDPKIAIPYSQQANFGVERAVSRDWVAGVNYVMVRGVKLLRSRNLNLFPPTVLTLENAASLGVARPNPQQIGRRMYSTTNRPDPNFGNIHQVSSSSSSTYHGMQVMVQKRFSRGFQFRANYTFSKAIDDASDFTQAQQPADPFDARSDRSLSTEDQRHRFTLAGLWRIPYGGPGKSVLGGWSLSSIWTFRGGTPENVTVGADSNTDGNSNDRPFNGAYTLGRNTYITPESRTIHMRLAKRVAIREKMGAQVLIESFNTQNRVNFTGVSTVWGTDLLPRATLGQKRRRAIRGRFNWG